MKYFLALLGVAFYCLSCHQTGPDLAAGKKIFTKYCVQCHGEDGKLGLNNSKDLTKSTIEFEEAINQVTNGKGMMTPYKDILNAEEIESVVHYVFTLRE